MASEFEEIRDLLARHERCFRELYELQVKEREHLTKLDMEALEAGNNRKETLALQVRALEEARVRLCGEIARREGVDPSEVTLSFLCEHCEPELKADFEGFATSFRTLARELEAFAQKNKKLVQTSLNIARNMERMLRRLVSDQPTYTPSGEMGQSVQNCRLMTGTL